MVRYDKDDREVDSVFIKHYRKGRRNGLSLTDAVETATNHALSRIKTIQERKR